MSSTPQKPSTKTTGINNLQKPEQKQPQQQKQPKGIYERIAALLRKAADLKAKAKAQKPAKCISLLIASLAAILIFSSRPSNEEIRLYTSIHV